MIEVEGLTKRYGDVTAVDDLTFAVRPGRVTAFLGPNGAGKTTTARIVLGLDRPTRGRALVNGVHYRELRHPLREVGALLDAGAAHKARRAVDHLRWLARSNGIGMRRVDRVLELVGLADVGRRRAGRLSLGMSQRLGLAAALLGDPAILLLDEPGNGLDPEGLRWIRTMVRTWAAEGRAVLVSSHLMAEVAVTAEHLVVIAGGRLLADTATDEFVRRHCVPTALARTAQPARLLELLAGQGLEARHDAGSSVVLVPGADTAAVGRVAAAGGIALDELSSRADSLEEAFLRLTADASGFRATAPAVAS
ncbi:ABC transporter ATP-binding protein [Actinosynnema sp. NPDC059797]